MKNGHRRTRAGGEIGHASVEMEEEEACNCGNKGCLEQYASATGIARLARRAMASGQEESVLRSMENVTAKDVFDAYKDGDALAAKVVDQFARYLGNALAIFSCVADPDVIVIGGGVSKAGQVLIDCVESISDSMHLQPARIQRSNLRLWAMMRESMAQQN